MTQMSTAHSVAVQRRPAERATLRAVPSKGRSGTTTFWMTCILLLVTGLVALLGLNTMLAKGAFTLSTLNQQSGALSDEANHLTQELASASSTRNLAEKAGNLGMVRAGMPGFIDPKTSKVTGVATAGTTAGAPTVVTSPTQTDLPPALGVPAPEDVPQPAKPAPKPAPTPAPAPAPAAKPTAKPSPQPAKPRTNQQQSTPQQGATPARTTKPSTTTTPR